MEENKSSGEASSFDGKTFISILVDIAVLGFFILQIVSDQNKLEPMGGKECLNGASRKYFLYAIVSFLALIGIGFYLRKRKGRVHREIKSLFVAIVILFLLCSWKAYQYRAVVKAGPSVVVTDDYRCTYTKYKSYQRYVSPQHGVVYNITFANMGKQEKVRISYEDYYHIVTYYEYYEKLPQIELAYYTGTTVGQSLQYDDSSSEKDGNEDEKVYIEDKNGNVEEWDFSKIRERYGFYEDTDGFRVD